MGVIALSRGTAIRPVRPNARPRIRCRWPVVLIPLVAVFASGLAEIGSLVVQAAALHRGLDAAVAYASRRELPLSDATRMRIKNIAMTGSPDGHTPPLVSGWTKAGADIQIERITHRVAGSPVSAVRIVLSVPYVPLFGGFLPLPSFHLQLSRDQVVTAE